MEGEAAAKRHSTTGDAIAAAQAAGAAATVLTHFSQRYPKVPALMTGDDAQQRAVDHTVGIAFDLLRLDLADGLVLPALTRPLARLIDALEMGALVAAPAAGASQRESRVR
jgi:ribonuclease Z